MPQLRVDREQAVFSRLQESRIELPSLCCGTGIRGSIERDSCQAERQRVVVRVGHADRKFERFARADLELQGVIRRGLGTDLAEDRRQVDGHRSKLVGYDAPAGT